MGKDIPRDTGKTSDNEVVRKFRDHYLYRDSIHLTIILGACRKASACHFLPLLVFYFWNTKKEEAMLAEKVSISLPPSLLEFIERYKENHALKSRSKVIEMALERLRQEGLEAAYREAATEADSALAEKSEK